MSAPLASLSAAEREALRPERLPSWREPTLATLTDERFSDERWIYERKLDGVRCLVRRENGEVSLRSRNRKDLTPRYPELVEALESRSEPDVLADGEVVAFEGPRTSFARLQGRSQLTDPRKARATGIAVYLYLFDLLHVDGHDVRRLPLHRRKVLLRRSVELRDPIRSTQHRRREGEAFWREACRKGWEGVIAKRADRPYQGGRSTEWLKFKCHAEQELVVVGWTDPQGSRSHLGALLVGYHADGDMRYAGKVGTGYDESELKRLHGLLAPLERDTPPIADPPARATGVHWSRPELVAQIAFSEWTRDGRLRHPRYLGLRDDKDPSEVVQERPAPGAPAR